MAHVAGGWSRRRDRCRCGCLPLSDRPAQCAAVAIVQADDLRADRVRPGAVAAPDLLVRPAGADRCTDVADRDPDGRQWRAVRRRLVGKGQARDRARGPGERRVSQPLIAPRWQLLALALVVGFLIYLLAPVLTPF